MNQGLLGMMDDPQSMGLLSMGLRLMSTPGKFGAALGSAGLGALGDVQQMQQQQAQRKRGALQDQMLQMQLQQVIADQERKKAVEGAYRGAMRTPDQQAMAQNGGPTMAAAAAAPGLSPQIDQAALIRNLMQADPMAAYQMLQPKPADYKVVGDSLVSVGPGGVKEAYRAPQKPASMPSGVQEYEYAVRQGYKGTFEQFDASRKRAGATSVTVGTGKVGELETTYRKEFNTLPEVTRYKSALPAFKAVEGAATRPGTQSEINLIYGLAKLYDPESVVREGEYDTIANSQSIPEWLKGQAQRLQGGGKLTPETKRQILIEARARKKALEDEYNGAQRTYDGIARRQGLDPQNIFTPVGGYAAPDSGKPKSRIVPLDGGGSATATLGEDGNYYVKRGGKTYRVEE